MASRFARIGTAIASVGLAVVMAAPAALAYPPNPATPQVIGGGRIVVVNQQTANQVTPRKLLRRLGTTLANAQNVAVRRGAAVGFVPTHLATGYRYVVSARVNGKWVVVGSTSVVDRNGQAQLPVIRLTRNGQIPIRLARGTTQLFFNTVTRSS